MKTPAWRLIISRNLRSEYNKLQGQGRQYNPGSQWREENILKFCQSLAGRLFSVWAERGSGMWKIPLFYLNRILNFNSESITRIIVCCMKFRKIEKSPNLWCSRQSSDHRLGWGWKPGIICLLGRDVLLVSVARAAPLATLSTLRLPFPQQKSFNSKEVLSYTKFFI